MKALKGWDRYIFHRNEGPNHGQDKLLQETGLEGDSSTPGENSKDPRPAQKVHMLTDSVTVLDYIWMYRSYCCQALLVQERLL